MTDDHKEPNNLDADGGSGARAPLPASDDSAPAKTGQVPGTPTGIRHPTPGRTEQAAINKARAMKLRLLGWSFQRIADELGLAKSTVYGYVSEQLEELRKERAELGDKVRDMELAKLDDWDNRLYALIEGDPVPCECPKCGVEVTCPECDEPITVGQRVDGKELRETIDRLAKLAERRAKLLGIDAPEKIEVDLSVIDELSAEVINIALRFIPEDRHSQFRDQLASLLKEAEGESL